MLSNYSFDTSFGEVSLADLSESEWNDIQTIAAELMQRKEVVKIHQAAIAAFIIWISEKEFMSEPKSKWDLEH